MEENKREPRQNELQSKSKNPLLIEAIAEHFDQFGIYMQHSDQIRNEVLKKLPADAVPSSMVVRKIMRDTFHLKFKTLEKANLKYRDPLYNEKRLWVSRLLGQFILEEDTVIVSIDESNFRHDSLPSKQWQFDQSKVK
jgi:hypothetical protein